MANNRMYLAHSESKKYILIAKNDSYEWYASGNKDLDLLLERVIGSEKLILGTENDDEFFKAYIESGECLNVV